MLKKAARIYLKFAEAVCVFLLLLILCLMMIQISFRILNIGQSFSEEMARYCFCIMIFFGAPLVLAEGADICVDMVVNILPAAIQKIIRIAVNGLIAVFSIFCLKSIVSFIISNEGITAVTVTWIKMNWIYTAVAVGFVFLFIVSVIKLVANVCGTKDTIDINEAEKARMRKEEQEIDLGI